MFMPGLKAFLKMSESAFFGSGSAGLGISADAIAWARGSIRQKEDSRTATLPLRRRNRMVSASSRRGIGIFVAGSATVPDEADSPLSRLKTGLRRLKSLPDEYRAVWF